MAFVAVDESAGLAEVNSRGHVSLWMYERFDPVASVADVVRIDDYEP